MDTTQLLKGVVLDVAVLAVLNERNGYGYDVVRRLREAGLSGVGDASAYRTLRRQVEALRAELADLTSPERADLVEFPTRPL